MRILLAEDRASLRTVLAETLTRAGYQVVEAAEGRAAMALVEEGGFDLALFDLKMPVHSGTQLLLASRERWLLVPVVLLTAYGSVEVAVSAMKSGAFDFLSKPIDTDHLLIVVERALDASRQERRQESLETELGRSPIFQGIVGGSDALRKVQEEAAKIARTDTTCLILGETGVGKELFARAIHDGGPRRDEPFVAVNCAAIPATLLENELFGHEKGAYTGAHESRMGRFELAHRGTIFLDEIGEMGPELQAKLLRVLEEKRFTRVGGARPVIVDVRVLCATNRELSELIRAKLFREDLYYRLSAFPIRIPPLRERREDIPLLAAHFVNHFRQELARPSLRLVPEAEDWLVSQPWPGNVRELMNRIERAAILAEADGAITSAILAGGGGGAPPSVGVPEFSSLQDPEEWLREEERWRAVEILRRCGGDRRRAARILGLTPVRMNELLAPQGQVEP